MRFLIIASGLAALLAGCGNERAAEEKNPPPPELLPMEAGPPPPTIPPAPPPPVAPPPPMPNCSTQTGVARPPGTPSPSECARRLHEYSQERLRLRDARLAKERADYVRPEFVSFEKRVQPEILKQRADGWINRMEPTPGDACKFTERPKGSVPASFMRTAYSGNMDLWSEWDVLLHDHAIGFVGSYFSKKDQPVIAVRPGKPDLWIEPVEDGDRDIILFIGPQRFECVYRTEP